MIHFDATFFALVALVLFLALVFYMGVPGKVLGALDARAEKIRNDLEEARRLREEAQALFADFQRRAREAENEAQVIIDEATAEAQRMANEAGQALDEMITRRTKNAEDKIAQAEAQAVADVRARAVDVAIAAAQQVLSKSVPGEIDTGLVDSSIKQVTERMN